MDDALTHDGDTPRAWSLDEPSDPVMEHRLREIVRLAPIGIGIVDMAGHTVLTNGALSAMLGYTADEFAHKTFDTFTHPDDIERNARLFDQMVAGEIDAFEMDKRFIHRDGHVVWGRLQVSLLRDDADGPAYAIGMLQDVTEERRLRDELERLAFEDPLTGLANRRLFHDRVEHQLRHGKRLGSAVGGAVLFADLDDFKFVNDTFGHEAGDRMLGAIADRVRGCLRPGDTGGRLGGDEFAVLLEDVTSESEAIAVADRLRAAIAQPVVINGRTVRPAVSIGVAMLADCADTDEVLRAADVAMYAAKSGGKDRSVAYGGPAGPSHLVDARVSPA
jgi:diguanylate cyclase (GGDEF)-like protein/PAS domain S-box-containing protein